MGLDFDRENIWWRGGADWRVFIGVRLSLVDSL